ncbi:MAG: hypothetical protein ACRD2N_24450, partial [Vicinamibacterales bacterium]
FCGFRKAGNVTGPVSAVVHDPKQPKELYAAVGKQVFATTNGGAESDGSRTANPKQAGHRSDEAGQLVTTGR